MILYSDTRAKEEAQTVVSTLGADRLKALTGNEQDAGSLLAKLQWLARFEPEMLRSSRQLLFGSADYAALKMTGQAATDSTTAATTGLMELDRRRPLEPAILEELGLAEVTSLLPPIRAGGGEVGRLRERVATELGLPANIPVHHGPGDAGSATLGAGAGVIGPVYAYLGTSGWVAFSASERADPEQGAITLAHPHPERTIQVAPLLTAGGNLAWLRNLFGDEDYGEPIAEALERPPAPLLYLPYLNGERSPFRDPHARGTFVGLEGGTQKADLYRAVLEGVAYGYRHALEALTRAPFTQLTLTGGGARSAGWCQLFADLLGTTVTVLEDAENVGVRGAVLAAQVTRGELSDYRLPVKHSQIFQPDKTLSGWFERQYAVFRDLYPALRSTFARLGSSSESLPGSQVSPSRR